MWFDSDAIVNLTHFPMNVLIDSAPTRSVWIGHNHDNKNVLCAGVFLVKNNHIGRKFIKRCIDVCMSRKYFQQGKNGMTRKYAVLEYEQGVMDKVAGERAYENQIARAAPSFIRNGPVSHDSFILHYYGNKNRAIKRFKKINQKIHSLPWSRNPKPLRICVLLTTFAISKRVFLYQKIIDAWEETGIPLYVVDSSGEDRLRAKNYLCFDQFQHVDYLPSQLSMMEKLSIRTAIDAFHFDQYDIIVKITGKYFIPDLVYQLEHVPNGTDMIIQANVRTHGQNSECFGATLSVMSTILNRIDLDTSFERAIYKSLSNAELQVIRLPKNEIPKQERVKRSNNSVLAYL
jgi:hypothetical protein